MASPANSSTRSTPRNALLGVLLAFDRRTFLRASVVVAAILAIAVVWWVFAERRHKEDRQEGLKLAQLGRFNAAQPHLLAALEHKPDDVEVIKALAQGSFGSGDLDRAQIYLTRWCDLRPAEAEPFQKRMDLWQVLNRYGETLSDGRRVLELDPENLAVRQKMAMLLLGAGRFDEAEQECRRCLERQPGNLELIYMLANINRNQGKNAQAGALLDPIVRSLPKAAGAAVLRAILYYEAGQPELAIPLFRQALAQEPEHQQAKYYLGLCLARVGQTEEAERLLSQVKAP